MKERKERVLTLKDKLQVLENNIVYFPKLEKLDEWDRNLVQEELGEMLRNVKDIKELIVKMLEELKTKIGEEIDGF